jgi:hypothetical protein
MPHRIVTAREQYELLAPWLRTAAVPAFSHAEAQPVFWARREGVRDLACAHRSVW